MSPQPNTIYPGLLAIPAPIPDLPPVPSTPADYYDQAAWVKWAEDRGVYERALALHAKIMFYLGYLGQWINNTSLWQALGAPMPDPPTPPEGYPAAKIIPAPYPAPPSSPIGAISSDGPNIYFGHGDSAPVGTPYKDAAGSTFVKIVHNQTPWGVQDRWLKIS